MERIDAIVRDPLFQKCLKKNKKAEEDREFCKHDLQHFVAVARITYILMLESGSLSNLIEDGNLTGQQSAKEVIYAAGILHDVGRWRQYEAFSNQRIFASPLCKTVLTQMVGAERTGKSIFVEGRLNDYHRRPLPLRAVNDAERLLPIRESISTVTDVLPYKNRDFGLDFFELPYGQTEGTLYGLLETEGLKTLFASDLFVMINNRMWQGNVARGRFPCHITGLGSKGGAKGRSFCFLLYSAICRCITTAFLILRAPGRFKQGTFILLRKMQQEPSPLQSQSSST
jgi:hypothetical protein